MVCRARHQLRSGVIQDAEQKVVEPRRQLIEHLLHVRVGRAARHVGAGDRRPQVLRGGVAGLQRKPFLDDGPGLSLPALPHQQHGEAAVRAGACGRHLRRGAVGLGRLVVCGARVQDVTQVVVRLRVPGIELDRSTERGHGLVGAAAPAQHDAEVVVGIGAQRVERDCLLVRGHRLVQLSDLFEHVAQVGLDRCRLRCDGGGPADQIERTRRLAELMRQHAAKVQRVGMIRRDGQDTVVEFARLHQAAVLVQPHGQRQRFVRRESGRTQRLGPPLHHACFVVAAERGQHGRQVAMRLGVRRVECDRAPQRSSRLFESLETLQHDTEVVLEAGVSRLQLDRLEKPALGRRRVAKLQRQQSAGVYDARVIRRRRQHTLEERLRLGQPALTLELQRPLEHRLRISQ